MKTIRTLTFVTDDSITWATAIIKMNTTTTTTTATTAANVTASLTMTTITIMTT